MLVKTIAKSKITYRFLCDNLVVGEWWVVKGTDVVLMRCSNGDKIAYSKQNTGINGSCANEGIHSQMLSKGFAGHYGIYSSSDLNYVLDYHYEDDSTKVAEMIRRMKGPKVQRNPEYGVELELESETSMSTEIKDEIANFNKKLIHDVGSDPSVRNGCEIRFNHPAMSGWKYKDISSILKFCKEKGAITENGTAGMHIHISRRDIKPIVTKFRNNLRVMQDILYPINCRELATKDGSLIHYGVGDNIYHDQTLSFGTLEIRAWNATLNPKMFLARIKFCKTFTEWLATTTEVCIESFFNFMNEEEKRNYKYMLLSKENPHKWGFPAKAVEALLA